MIDIGRLVPTGLASALRKAPLCDEKVALAWRIAVGPAIDQATKVRLVDGVLHVDVTRPEWQREIRRSSGIIRSRLNVFLGDDAVRALKVTVAGVEATPPRRRPAGPTTVRGGHARKPRA